MSYFTIKRSFWVVPSLDVVKEYEKIDKLLEVLEKSNVGEIINYVKLKDKKCKGRDGYNPHNLFVAIIYCFAKFKGSLRDIEDKCRFDIRVNYIMEGQVPHHTVIGDFINDYIVLYQFEIFTMINKQIIKELNLDISNTYNDGTKFEANANKYKFVWKPTKYHQKLDIKIREFLAKIDYDCNNKENYIKAYEFNQILKNYADRFSLDIYNLPSGRGCRYTKEQKIYKEGYKYLLKLLEYEEKEELCGENRNSYYKTDKDATAMVLKEDYYSKLSNDFYAGYNVQVIVSSLLILMYGVYQDRADYYTFIPMIDNFKKYYGSYPKNICADSGYGIYFNYEYLKKHNIGNYVKFQSWKSEASGKCPQLFKLDNNNNIICLNGIIGNEYKTNTHPKMQDGKFYIWNGCNSCNYTYKCKAHMKEKK